VYILVVCVYTHRFDPLCLSSRLVSDDSTLFSVRVTWHFPLKDQSCGLGDPGRTEWRLKFTVRLCNCIVLKTGVAYVKE